MGLKERFLLKLGDIEGVSFKRMFGWEAILINGKLAGGYRMLDVNLISLMLILSEDDYNEVIEAGVFVKYSFGKTWVEAEIGSEEELEDAWGSVRKAVNRLKDKGLKSEAGK